MSKFRNLIWFSFNYLVCFVSSNVALDVCEQRSACSCVFPSGMGVDLTPTSNITFQAPYNRYEFNESQIMVFTYYFHPCVDIIPNLNISMNPDTQTCGEPLSLARTTFPLKETATANNTYVLSNEKCERLGIAKQSSFTNKNGVNIVFPNGSLNNTVILSCIEEGDDRLVVYDGKEPVTLMFFSKHACLMQIEAPGRSLGSTLLIVFFCLVIFYLVLGVCTKKFLMGATGIEVIPNLGFWTDLPNLVKDGWAFAINGFKLPARSNQMSSPDPNSYDSI